MVTQTYRANLTAADFPLLSELQGRTVIISGIDQNFSRQLNSIKNKDRDIGIPQVYYGHNVLPTDAGFTSIGYQQIATAPVDTDFSFNNIYLLRDTADNRSYFATTTSGHCYVLQTSTSGWLRTTDKQVNTSLPDEIVTVAHVHGQSYICFGGIGTYVYNVATNILDHVVLTGLSDINVRGIVASNGYLLAWTEDTVVWSSTIDPTDFTPSLLTGAGGGDVEDIKGTIVAVIDHPYGIAVCTRANIVMGAYTGNAAQPFAFKNSDGSGGISGIEAVATGENTIQQYAYTTYGFQLIDNKVSLSVFPELTDFIAGSKFEDFDEVNYVFNVTSVVIPLVKKLTYIANRYFIISYGITSLTHCIVYDTALQRWGKLKIPHTACFEFIPIGNTRIEFPKRAIGFLQQDGTIKVAVITYDISNSQGVLILGKYQLERNSTIELQEIHMENVQQGVDINVRVLSTLDGKNIYRTTTPYLAANTPQYRKYTCRVDGLNHSIVFKGGFNLSSLEYKFGVTGRPR